MVFNFRGGKPKDELPPLRTPEGGREKDETTAEREEPFKDALLADFKRFMNGEKVYYKPKILGSVKERKEEAVSIIAEVVTALDTKSPQTLDRALAYLIGIYPAYVLDRLGSPATSEFTPIRRKVIALLLYVIPGEESLESYKRLFGYLRVPEPLGIRSN